MIRVKQGWRGKERGKKGYTVDERRRDRERVEDRTGDAEEKGEGQGYERERERELARMDKETENKRGEKREGG